MLVTVVLAISVGKTLAKFCLYNAHSHRCKVYMIAAAVRICLKAFDNKIYSLRANEANTSTEMARTKQVSTHVVMSISRSQVSLPNTYATDREKGLKW